MMKFKKVMALLLAVVLCAGLPAHTAKAVFCNGTHSLYFAGEGTEERTIDTHRVYYNLYVGEEQIHIICEIKKRLYYTRVCCSNCEYYTQNNLRTVEVHSLDHK